MDIQYDDAPMNTPTTPVALAVKPLRLRRTDEQRVAELQARIDALSRAQAAAATISTRVRARPVKKAKAHSSEPTQDAVDLELRELVESFVSSLREVVRKALIAQAKRALMEPARLSRTKSKPGRAS